MSQYCELCKIDISHLDEAHLLRWHDITREEYLEMYPLSKVYRNYTIVNEILKTRKSKKQIPQLRKECFTIYSHISIQGKALREAIYQVFDGKCFYTGKSIDFETMHIDHLVPKSRGGQDCIANYVLSSSFVNLSKRDKKLENIEDLIQRNIEIYAPKVLEILLSNNYKFLQNTGESRRYNPEKCIYKYTRILAEPQNELQAEFLEKLDSISRDAHTPSSIKKLEWLTELYQTWKKKLDNF